MKSNIKFVGLHAHSTAGSPYDAIGYPNQHMDFAFNNGSDALALTDHGNMNGLGYQVLHAKKMKKEGKSFKPIFGVEAYFHPDLELWRNLRQESKEKVSEDVSGAQLENESETKQKNKNPLKKRNHLVLLAQNQKGLTNIFSLVSKSFAGDNYYLMPRIDYKMLSEHSEGVLASSACLGGVYAGDYWDHYDEGDAAILRAMSLTTAKMQSIFGDRWFGELQWIAHPDQHKLNQLIIRISKEFNVPLISTCDSHYPMPESWKDRELYKKLNPKFVRNEIKSTLPPSIQSVGYELYPKNGDQMWESYKKYSEIAGHRYNDDLIVESFERTYSIAHEMIEEFLPDNDVKLPNFLVPANKTASEYLEELVFDGLAKKGIESEEYQKQIKHELGIIEDRGFSGYFVTMKCASDEAQEMMLTAPGRGSAAGSLVAYVLGITQVDPLKHKLLFSRFLRSDATDYPDIDYDLSDPMKFKDHLIQKWGEDKVVCISNWNTLKLKTLIKDISRFYKIPFIEANAVTLVMEKEAIPFVKKELGVTAGVVEVKFEHLLKYSKTLKDFLQKYPEVKTHINTLFGQVKSCSRHAGGVVIGESLSTRMPLIKNLGVTQTPWSEGQNVRHLEPMGFIKFDYLGLGTLRMFEDAIELILQRHFGIKNPTFEDVKKFYNEKLHPDVINFDDQKVYENVFHKGNWAGIFQFAEKGMQSFAKRSKPTSLMDLTALTSIWRPGPMSAKVPEKFIKAKKSGNISYRNAALEPFLKETYGFLIFQEQIAQIVCGLGEDISEDDGNKLRKILTKKGTGNKLNDQIYDKFVSGCKKKKIPEKDAAQIWEDIDNFKQYGFNKSHALSYSIISFQCAWFLTYYAVEWLCAYLNQQGENSKEKAISEVKGFGFSIKPVNIDQSQLKWTPAKDNKSLIQPLNTLNGMGDAVMNKIINCRPYTSIDEMLFGEKKINKKALDVLIKAGALDNFMDDRFKNRKHMWMSCVKDKPNSKKNFIKAISDNEKCGDFSEEENIENFVSITGVFPFSYVLSDKIKQDLDDNNVCSISDLDLPEGFVWFIPRTCQIKRTRWGKEFWVLDVIDVSGKTTKLKCWGVKESDYKLLHFNRPYMAKVKYDDTYGFSITGFNQTTLMG